MAKKKKSVKKKKPKTNKLEGVPTLDLKKESDIAMDFATKVFKKFNKIIKSVILFGSSARQETVTGSDIDIIIILDDVAINWDQELIAWYRQELDMMLRNLFQGKELSLWW